MELRFNKKVGDVEQTMIVTFDAKSREDCAQAAFHATSFFGGDYGIVQKPVRDLTPDEIKKAFERIKDIPFSVQPAGGGAER